MSMPATGRRSCVPISRCVPTCGAPTRSMLAPGRGSSALLALLLAVACAAPPRPGDAGLGDSYFPELGNGGYDVSHYDLSLDIDPVANQLQANARIDATATEALSSFHLDLGDLDVDSVRVDDLPAKYEHQDGELIVTPAQPIGDDERFEVSVDYHGQPHGIETDAIPIPGGVGWSHVNDEIYVVSEPMGASSFFPCNDHPLDKATYSFEIVAPADYQVAANGLHIDTSEEHDGKRTHHWRASDPMASYLVTLAVAHLDLVEGQTPAGLPLRHYFHHDASDEARAAFDPTADMLAFYSEHFGDYPFEAYGAILASVPFPGALETQTIPVYGATAAQESVIAHEMAHQWFGDDVSLSDWSEIWLCEGFAEYASWLWMAHAHGQQTLQERLERTYRFLANPAVGRPADPGRQQIFGGGVYLRGAWTLWALHHAVGDETFFAIMRRYVEQHRNGNATIARFVDLVAELAGEEQRAPLMAWLYDDVPPPLPEFEEQPTPERKPATQPAVDPAFQPSSTQG